MKKIALIPILLAMSSCSWLALHPQVEADLEQEGIDVAKHTEKVVEDIIAPAPTPAAIEAKTINAPAGAPTP